MANQSSRLSWLSRLGPSQKSVTTPPSKSEPTPSHHGGSSLAAEPEPGNRARRSLRVRITFTVSSMMVAVSLTTAAITASVLVPISRDVAISQGRETSLSLAKLTARLIDVEEAQKIHDPSDQQTDTYLRLQKILSDVVQGVEGVGYAYIWKLKKTPTTHQGYRAFWVVDNETIGSSMFKPVGTEYPLGSRTDRGLDTVFKTGKAASDPSFYTDYAGTWISGYAPLRVNRDRGEVLVVGVDISARHIQEIQRSVLYYILAATALALLLTVPIGVAAGYWMCRPLKAITHRLKLLSELNLDTPSMPIQGTWIVEIDQLRDAIERLGAAMSSFTLYLPRDVVRKLLANNQMAKRGGTAKDLAIMFTDIRNFTSYTESTPIDILLEKLNDYLTQVSKVIVRNHGTIDKFIGDSVMAFWGAPNDVPQSATLACKAALGIRETCAALSREWQNEGNDLNFYTRIGIHFGPAVVGNLGSHERINYTAIGDSINTASRLEAANKSFNTDILASKATVTAIMTENNGAMPFRFRHIDSIVVRGKSERVEIYALEGLADESEAES